MPVYFQKKTGGENRLGESTFRFNSSTARAAARKALGIGLATCLDVCLSLGARALAEKALLVDEGHHSRGLALRQLVADGVDATLARN